MLLTAITFFVILTVLVLIHELGHFLVARKIGVKVEEFGLGLPPRIFGKKFGETIYSINWLPIGGFVRLAGEDEDPDNRPSSIDKKHIKHFFWARSKKERAAILVAGVFMNFVLAVLITAGLLTYGVHEPSGRVHVERTLPKSPAEQAGLQPGDLVLSVSSATKSLTQLKVPAELINFINDHKGQEVRLTVLRDGTKHEISATPRVDVPKGEGPLGVAISDLETKKYPLSQAPVKALEINLMRSWEMISSLAKTLWHLVTLQPLQTDVAGPIGIAQVTGQAVRFGWLAVLEFASILSLNLAILNILPVPALDGGRLAFVVFEKVLGRKVRPVFERNAHQVGMMILLFLVLLVSINDILRLVRG